METKSHLLLAKYLLKQLPHFDSALYQKTFIWGCIEPDVNIFTYLKGSRACQRFRGHNYNNTRKYTASLLEKLQGKRSWSLGEFFRLGKLMHYLSDAFTYPHNEHFPGTIWEHCAYEARLHEYFTTYLLSDQKKPLFKDLPGDMGEYIGEAHNQYLRISGDIKNDAKFITQATSRVMAALMHRLPMVCR